MEQEDGSAVIFRTLFTGNWSLITGYRSNQHSSPRKKDVMPTYTCIAAAGLLDSKQKSAIARVVTLAHAEITGAPTHFAQVFFQEVSRTTTLSAA